MNILVAGASGFLGSRLCNYLSSDHNLIALVRKQSAIRSINQGNIKIYYIEDSPLESVMSHEKVDVVINAVTCYGRSGECIEEIRVANLTFPLKVFQAAIDSGVGLFLNCGTSLPPKVNQYATLKREFVRVALALDNLSTKFVNLELEHFYGKGDSHSKFTTYVFDTCKNGGELNLTSGKQKRDFIHIADVLSAIKFILECSVDLRHAKAVSLGSGIAPTVHDFVLAVDRLCGQKATLNFGARPDRENEPDECCADLSFLSELGWSPKYDYLAGIAEVLKSNG